MAFNGYGSKRCQPLGTTGAMFFSFTKPGDFWVSGLFDSQPLFPVEA